MKKRMYMIPLLIGFLIGFIVGDITTNANIETSSDMVSIEDVSIPVETSSPEVVSLGLCKLTAYCNESYPHVCNNGDSSVTATGTIPTVGRTVAVDPSVIPYGSEVIIYGKTYIAEDCGGAVRGNKVDILFDTHEEALKFGVRYAEVSYIVKEND